jgi:hypothetical protein
VSFHRFNLSTSEFFNRKNHKRPSYAIDPESALTSTSDISLHCANCREGPLATFCSAKDSKQFRVGTGETPGDNQP